MQGDGIAYLVMELVPGEALSTILTRDGAMTTPRTLSILAQSARALHAAHVRGVVHRDVKPANLMVTPEGRVKVTDFGIARPVDHEPLTMTGQVMGTAHYLAPELARGHDATPLSDVYALGVVAYECLAGHRPFEGDNQVLVATAHLSQEPPPLPATLPRDVVAVIGAAMAKDPTERIGSAEQFAVALERLASNDPRALEGIRVPGRPITAGGSYADQARGYGAAGSGYPSAGYGLGAGDPQPGYQGGQGYPASGGYPVAGGYPASAGYPATGGNPAPGGAAPQSPYSWPGLATTGQVPVAGANGGPATRPGGAVPPGGIFPPTGTFRPAEYDFQRNYGGPGEDGDDEHRNLPRALWAAIAIVAIIGLIVLIFTIFNQPGGNSIPTPSSGVPSQATRTSGPATNTASGTSPSSSRKASKSSTPSSSSTTASPSPSSPAPSSPKPTPTPTHTPTPTPTPTPSVTVSPTPSVTPPSPSAT
jgi:serine/threonine-protein kinase